MTYLNSQVIAARLTQLRKARGETPRGAAHRIGIHHTTLLRLERAECGTPYLSTLVRIARAYGVSLEQLTEPASANEYLEDAWQSLPAMDKLKLLLSPSSQMVWTLRLLRVKCPELIENVSARSGLCVIRLCEIMVSPFGETICRPGIGNHEHLCKALEAAGIDSRWFSFMQGSDVADAVPWVRVVDAGDVVKASAAD